MFAINSIIVLLFVIIPVSHSQRRIKDGVEVKSDRRYVVYLVESANRSESGYTYWLCGGAIVSEMFVITSAACVNDVDYIYVIAGYKKYVHEQDIETDKCTAEMKKKAIYTCSPKGYELKFPEIDYWANIDIALVKVDSPFNFNDPKYETLCSYKPVAIPINYEEKYQAPGTDAMVLGWGHIDKWRVKGDIRNYNTDTLRYAPTLILNKSSCIEHYSDYKNMSRVINTYMICTLGKGNIDDAGDIILQSLPIQNGCTSEQQKLLGFEGVSCEQRSSEENYYDDDTRRQNRGYNKTNNASVSDFNETQARRSGICQNDHGGPLVTWVGAREILIGVASVFKVSEKYDCMGPYLYTSTLCTGLFLDCVINSQFPSRRRDLCDRPASERGYDLIERTISWKDHPDGTAKNENIGRMPKEKISAGLKYLTNNNYNQPSQQSNAENIMNADNVKKQEETKYESNNKYSVNKNPTILSNVPQDRFKVIDSYPENKSISEKESFLVNDRYPVKQSFPVNDGYPAKQLYPRNEGYPANGMYPVTGRFPVSVGPLQNPKLVPSNIAVRPQRPIRN